MVGDASEVLTILLSGGHSVVAGRLAGAFRNIGRNKIADEIIQSMRAAGYDVRESDPFDSPASFAHPPRALSAYVIRMRLSWQQMRESVLETFPEAPGIPKDTEAYLKTVDEIYVEDAYHSLSIEGYRVSRERVDARTRLVAESRPRGLRSCRTRAPYVRLYPCLHGRQRSDGPIAHASRAGVRGLSLGRRSR